MFNRINRTLWRGIKQAGKAQLRQNTRLTKALLGPSPAPRKKTTTALKAKTAVARPPRKTTASPGKVSGAERLPGTWLSSYYDSTAHAATSPARRMQYWLYVPSVALSISRPLVVMLHGCDQTAQEFARATRMNQLAEDKGFAVLYPQQSLKGHPQRCWPWYEQSVQHGGDEVALVAGCIDKVLQQYPFDRCRIYIAGLSAGAAMAHILALTFPQGFAAVGLHSGPVFGAGHTRMGAYAVMQGGSHQASTHALDQFGPLPAMPAILLGGRDDRVVRGINQEQLTRQFKTLNQLGPDSASAPVHKPANARRAAHVIQDYRARSKLLLRVCDIDGLGHAWSGGDGSVKYAEAKGPDASVMMWDFFARHRRRDIG